MLSIVMWVSKPDLLLRYAFKHFKVVKINVSVCAHAHAHVCTSLLRELYTIHRSVLHIQGAIVCTVN